MAKVKIPHVAPNVEGFFVCDEGCQTSIFDVNGNKWDVVSIYDEKAIVDIRYCPMCGRWLGVNRDKLLWGMHVYNNDADEIIPLVGPIGWQPKE